MTKRKREKFDYYTIPSIQAFREKLTMRVNNPNDNFEINDRTMDHYCYHAYLVHKDLGIPFDQKPTIEAMEEWRAIAEKSLAPFTLCLKVTSYNHFLNLVWNIDDYRLRRPKNPERVKEPQPLEKDTIETMFKHYFNEGKYTWAYAILSQFEMSCRVGSLLDIRLEDIKNKDQEVFLRTMKYGFTQNVVVSPQWLEKISEYIEKYRPEPKSEDDKNILFIHDDGKRLKNTSYAWALKRVATHLGIETSVHSHIFRHSGIMYLKRDCDMEWVDIQKHITGHKSESGMESYKHSVSVEKIKEKRRNGVDKHNSSNYNHRNQQRKEKNTEGINYLQENTKATECIETTDNAEYTYTIDGKKSLFSLM